MVDFETIIFLDLLNDLVRRSKDGIHPFSSATRDYVGLLYDDSKPLGENKYPLVEDCIMIPGHEDIVSTYVDWYNNDGIDIVAVVNAQEEESYVLIILNDNPEQRIIVEDGEWYIDYI